MTLTGAATDGISGNTFCQCFAQCFRPTRGRKDIDMAILESTCWSCQLDKATSFIHGRKVYSFTLLTYSFFTEGAVYSWASTCFNIIHSLSDCAMRGLQDSRKAGQCLSRPAMQKPVVAQVEPFSPFLVLCWGTHPFGTASKKNSNCSFRILLLVLLTAVLRTPAAPTARLFCLHRLQGNARNMNF